MADSFNLLFAEAQEFTATETDQLHELGTPGLDQYGNWFTFAEGVASTVLGDLVQMAKAGTTVRATLTTMAAAAEKGEKLLVAVSSNVASQFGFYLRSLQRDPDTNFGISTLASAAANVDLYATATAGAVDDAVVAGVQVGGLFIETATGGSAAVNTDPVFPDGLYYL